MLFNVHYLSLIFSVDSELTEDEELLGHGWSPSYESFRFFGSFGSGGDCDLPVVGYRDLSVTAKTLYDLIDKGLHEKMY